MNTTALAVSFHVFRCVLVDCRPPSAPMLSSLLPSGIRRILTGTPTKPGWCFLDLTRLPSKQQLRWLQTRKLLAYQESTCTNLSVSYPYEIIDYYVLKHIKGLGKAKLHF